jgi:hypothetical protein
MLLCCVVVAERYGSCTAHINQMGDSWRQCPGWLPSSHQRHLMWVCVPEREWVPAVYETFYYRAYCSGPRASWSKETTTTDGPKWTSTHQRTVHWIPVMTPWEMNPIWVNRVIRKVRKTQHHNPECGHTQGEIKKNLQKKYISIQGGDETQKTISFGIKLSFTLSFFFPEHLHCCYMCFHCS